MNKTSSLTNAQRNRLSQLIEKHYNLSELKTLCFWLGLDHELLSNEGKRDRVQAMIRYCERHGQTADLLYACRQNHPTLDWPHLPTHPTTQSSNPPATPNSPILIIEDDPDWQANLHALLTEAGFTAVVQSSYVTAMRWLTAQTPAAIILDLQLRQHTVENHDWAGWRLAQQAQTRSIPLIIVSGHSSLPTLRRSFTQYQVANFFDKAEFVEVIDQFLFSVTDAVYG